MTDIRQPAVVVTGARKSFGETPCSTASTSR